MPTIPQRESVSSKTPTIAFMHTIDGTNEVIHLDNLFSKTLTTIPPHKKALTNQANIKKLPSSSDLSNQFKLKFCCL